uniref:Phosphoinositide phospholipase C n=1 Tax=Cyprinus carpio TaxID=7962 RepID=A0A8C1I7E0_CYPCA
LIYYYYFFCENEFLDIATIRDTRAGKYAKLPKHPKVRNVFNMDFPDSHHLAKALTIVTGPDTVNLTYHNFFAAKEVAQMWADDILAIAYNTLRANALILNILYLLLMILIFRLSIFKMFPADKKRVEAALVAANLPKGKFDTIKPDVFTEAAFKTFILHLCPRPEINEIFTSFTKGKGFMTKEMLTKFLNEKQRDSRLNEELFPLVRPEQVKNLIEKYEPSSSNASRGQISPEGLMFYLMGSETSVVKLDKLAQSHDMTQPIPHYFVKSSHNTYLTAGQLTGVSSPEMYRQCLLAGCRCLELDCWKGKPPDEEPIITHGFTMTTEILFKVGSSNQSSCCYYGIKWDQNLCCCGSLKPGHPVPSPSELMGKILIKNKKNDSTDRTKANPIENNSILCLTAPDDREEHDDHDEQDEEKMKNSDEGTAGQEVTAYEEMSALVNYVQPNKFISFENAAKKNKSFVISSFVETKGESLIAKNAVDWVEYNKRQMSRIYPKGTRVDSSNYSPQPFWTAGCQFVALNYQTMDFPMQLNMALFEFNGRTGYILKHDVLRRSDKKFDPFTDRIDTIIASTLTIKIYSGQFLSDKHVKTGVEVELIGLPKDPKRKYRTKWSTTPNGINPEWNEEPFVFEKILLPEMAYLRLVVQEEGGKFLGHRIIPLDAMQTGFQHICLRSESNMPLTLPSVFVHIEVKDYIPAAFAGTDLQAYCTLLLLDATSNNHSMIVFLLDFSDALFNPICYWLYSRSGGLFSDAPTVTCEELQQHKNFLKVAKKQEKDLKDMEKKFQKKREELVQKYSDQFKALKKKSTGKKSGDDPGDQINELKQKLKSELRALLVEQHDQIKKKKEQNNTEVKSHTLLLYSVAKGCFKSHTVRL